jgi:hypothetical protein
MNNKTIFGDHKSAKMKQIQRETCVPGDDNEEEEEEREDRESERIGDDKERHCCLSYRWCLVLL